MVMEEGVDAFFVVKGDGCKYNWLSPTEKKTEKEGVVIISMDRENVEMVEGEKYKLSEERTC